MDIKSVLDLYQDVPWLAKLHLRIRWRTAPFLQVAKFVPAAGKVLEIGCGYGLFSSYLALWSPKRHVLGIDIDEKKIRIAREAAGQARGMGANLSFEIAKFGGVPRGPWDVIAFVDVLYLLDADSQKRLIQACVSKLAPGGVILIKEMAPSPRWKYLWNLIQETLSVRVLRLTAGSGRFTFTTPAIFAKWLKEVDLSVEQHYLHRGYLHPHHLVIGRRS